MVTCPKEAHDQSWLLRILIFKSQISNLKSQISNLKSQISKKGLSQNFLYPAVIWQDIAIFLDEFDYWGFL